MLMKNENKCLTANPNYIYDEACLDILSNVTETVKISAQYLECQNCTFQPKAVLNGSTNTSILVNTKYQLKFEATFDNVTCERTLRFDEHARYGWNITNGSCSQMYVKQPADNAYLPILGALIAFFCFGTLWYMVKCIYRCTHRFNLYRRAELSNDLGAPLDGAPLVVEQTPTKKKHPNRIKSLDVFRGLCIIIMIFVNLGGGQYWFFKHSVWNGLTVADLVFPWFAWIMGMSINISVRARLRTALPRRQLALQILYRSCILIFIGVILNSHMRKTDLDDLRLPGVLQKLGVAYLVVGLLEAVFAKRANIEQVRIHNITASPQWLIVIVEKFERCAEDIIVAGPQWLIVICLVIIHTCITFLLPVPNCPVGYLGPGGLHDDGKYENCTGGAAGYLDRIIFGDHLYKTPTCHKMYETKVRFDPEGMLGTLTTILTVYLGVQAGRILNTYPSVKGRIYRWMFWAFLTGIIAGCLSNFSKEGGVIPINKNLWSLSYALALSSMAFVIETILYLLVDVTRKWGGRPLFYPGMNAITLFIGHEIFKTTFPFAWLPNYQTHREYLIMNLLGTAIWIAISIFLYKRNIFLKI